MSEIKVMSDDLSNKIAAGEVVERPKSIVKELVENAIDAGSTRIRVAIENSGITQITVEDDGKGMGARDALLSFQRHATSKIYSEDDLFQIHSLGFRGEALAAISSIADVELLTGQEHAAATRIHVKGGDVLENETIDERIGTKIIVKSLFYNTPARLKHLRSTQTEYMHILEFMHKTSLTHPNIRFEFTSNGNTVFRTFGTGKIPETLMMIYGEKIGTMLIPIELSDDDFQVRGYVSKPQAQRSHQRVLNISVNNRSVRHYGIQRAIVAGYGTLIPKGMFPIVALDITVDNKLVDVNVHPAKLEVRLSNEKQVEELIKRGIQQALMDENLIFQDTSLPRKIKTSEQMGMHLRNVAPNTGEHLNTATNVSTKAANTPNGGDAPVVNYPNRSAKPQYTNQGLSRQEQQAVINLYANSDNAALAQASENQSEYVVETRVTQIDDKNQTLNLSDKAAHSLEQQTVTVGSEFDRENMQQDPNYLKEVESEMQRDDSAKQVLRELHIIGQYDGTYILAQRNTNLYLIDQHAAQERIKYEEHMQAVRNMEQIAQQELLFPLTIRLDGVEMAVVKDYLPALINSGIDAEIFGELDIKVNAVPQWIKKEAIEQYVRKAIDVLKEYNHVDSALVREKELIMLSCKYSIKAHDTLNMAEMEALIYRLSEMEVPFTCPHGRPIIIEHTKYEVERWFKRA